MPGLDEVMILTSYKGDRKPDLISWSKQVSVLTIFDNNQVNPLAIQTHLWHIA